MSTAPLLLILTCQRIWCSSVYPNSVSRKNYTFLSTRTTKRLRRRGRQPKYPRLLIAINKEKMGFSRRNDTMESVQSNFSQCSSFLSFYSAIHVYIDIKGQTHPHLVYMTGKVNNTHTHARLTFPHKNVHGF